MITTFEALREELTVINDEISVVTPFQAKTYRAGLVAFRPRQDRDEKAITHADAEVICYVIEGQGQLQLPDEEESLSPGTVCHISRNTPHDFVAEGPMPLLMFYITVKVQIDESVQIK